MRVYSSEGFSLGQERQSPESFGQRTPSKFSVFLVQDDGRGAGDKAGIDMETDRCRTQWDCADGLSVDRQRCQLSFLAEFSNHGFVGAFANVITPFDRKPVSQI